MKHYLELVSTSSKIHKKLNRMSIICIILAVCLVTTIFGMADMFVQSQIAQAKEDYGIWHIRIDNISKEDIDVLATDPNIKTISPYNIINYRLDRNYYIQDKPAAICGCTSSLIDDFFPNTLLAGKFPENNHEAIINVRAKNMLNLNVGDTFTIKHNTGTDTTYTISGLINETPLTSSSDSYCVMLSPDAFQQFCIAQNEMIDKTNPYVYYIQFHEKGDIRLKISNLKKHYQLTDAQIAENTQLLGLLGQSSDSFMMQIYGVATFLFLLVLCAAIIMITGSLNSNVAKRTQFYGLIRCIGATRKQIMRLVRREALRWCRFAIPVGISLGIIIIWILSFTLRILSPQYFGVIPLFRISFPSIITGILVGLLTVLLAARSPAKRASKVSPLTAVSGNATPLQPVKKAAKTKHIKIDTSLGIHHALNSRKNFFLMVGSFSLSIILFLSFSVTVDFMHHSLTPLQPWTPDLSIISSNQTCSIDTGLLSQIKEYPWVDAVYGRMFYYDVPLDLDEIKKANIISYDEKQLNWEKKYLLSGSLNSILTEENTALSVYKASNPIQVGDIISLSINGETKRIKVVGIISDCPFTSDADAGTFICSEQTFKNLTGETGYTIIDMQLNKKASDEAIHDFHKQLGEQYVFSDERAKHSSARGIYYCYGLFIYGFLVMIALITIFNIFNSIALSVNSRLKQYGAFRAVGLSTRQLSKMIITESFVYALTGCVLGSAIGLFCNRILYHSLITFYWGSTWKLPYIQLLIILIIMLGSIILSVMEPIKSIHKMSIVDTISTP